MQIENEYPAMTAIENINFIYPRALYVKTGHRWFSRLKEE